MDTEATINDGHRGDDEDGDGIINEMARRQQSTTDTEITETMITREKQLLNEYYFYNFNSWHTISDDNGKNKTHCRRRQQLHIYSNNTSNFIMNINEKK